MARPLELQHGATKGGALHPEPPSEVHGRRPTQDEAQPSASETFKARAPNIQDLSRAYFVYKYIMYIKLRNSCIDVYIFISIICIYIL